MDILAGLTGLVIGALAAWGLVQVWAEAEMRRLRAHHQAQEAAAWAAGCRQGREDVVAIAHALARHGTGLAGGGYAACCEQAGADVRGPARPDS